MQMGVRVTPTFRLYKSKQMVRVVTGINEAVLLDAIDEEYDGVCVLPKAAVSSYDEQQQP